MLCSALTLAEACSYFVRMESREPKRRFPPPWKVEASKDQYRVTDANGVTLACIYSRDDLHASQWGYYQAHLTSDEARRIATAIARLPEFLKAEPAFPARGVTRIGRWRSSHPYHMALQEAYVQENYDEILACCRYNKVPFDAIRFWDKFKGKWIVGDDFIEPEQLSDLPRMKSLKHKGAI